MKTMGTLRPINDGELDLMRSWRNAPNVRRNMYTRHEISKEEHRSWWAGIHGSEKHLYLMYEFEGMPLGIVSFNEIDRINRNSSWAFYASPEAPRGTGSRMEFLALEYAFNNLELNKLCCEVLAFNTPVIALHKKFGFVQEGVLRHHHWFDDHYEDIHQLALLADEWKVVRGAMEEKLMGTRGSK